MNPLKSLVSLLALIATATTAFAQIETAIALPPPITLQASNMSPTGSGQAITTTNDTAAPGGTWVKIATTAAGQYIQFSSTSIPSGFYDVQFVYRTNSTRGVHTVTIDGTQIDSPIDQYAAGTSAYVTEDLGATNFSVDGATHTIHLAVTGKNSASTGYEVSAVQFIFTPISNITLQATDLTMTGTGQTITTTNDAAAPGGTWVKIASSAVGQYIQFTTPSIPAGTYNIDVNYRTNPTRGQHDFEVDGAIIATGIDQYAAGTSTYVNYQFVGSITATTGGVHTIRLKVTGKNASSTGYEISVTQFVFNFQQGPNQVAAPTFNPTAGTYDGPQSVAISSVTAGSSIRYTLDGSTPSQTNGILYSGPVTVNANATLKAIAYEANMTDSNVASAVYNIQAFAPTFSPAGGTYSNAQSVTISSATTGASIKYTTDGSTPTETNGTSYSGPVTIGGDATLQAVAYMSGLTDSDIGSATYNITLPPASTPTFSPAAGTYSNTQSVTITTATSGASIRYTTDGSTPSETAGTLYSGPVSVSASTTINAIAYAGGFADSPVGSATYTIGAGSGNFVLTPGVPIFVDSSEAGPITNRAIADLQRDLKKVLGADSPVVHTEPSSGPAIVVTCKGSATAAYRDSTLTSWESHQLVMKGTSSAPRMVLQGADTRGTIYAIYEFSDRYLDIPPLWFWGSWVPATQSSITIPANSPVRINSPVVQYRAFFPNDTDLISGWQGHSTSNFNAMFELIMRLKYNVLDVDTYGSTSWINECKARGIIVTFSHYDPFGGNISNYGSVVGGSPSANNLSGLKSFWTHYINNAKNDGIEVIESICFRGAGDKAWWQSIGGDPGSSQGRADVISNMMSSEVSLIKSIWGTASPIPTCRAIFYAETATFMAAGQLHPPQDPINMWNFVATQRDPYPFNDIMHYDYTQHLSGHMGIAYYFNLQFFTVGCHLVEGEGPWKVALNNYYVNQKAGPGNFKFEVLNVGNVREFLFEEAIGGDNMWNFSPTFDVDAAVLRFCTRYYGSANASQIASLYAQYYNGYWSQKKSDLTTFPNGFPRQFIFEDLRYARGSELIIPSLQNRSRNANPYNASTSYFVSRPQNFSVVPADNNNSSDQLTATVWGTNNGVTALTPVVSSVDSMYNSVPAIAKPLFNDSLRQPTHFMLGMQQFMHGLSAGDNIVSQGDSKVLPFMKEAQTGIKAAQSALSNMTQGTFSGWYGPESKFGVNSKVSSTNGLVTKYGG